MSELPGGTWTLIQLGPIQQKKRLNLNINLRSTFRFGELFLSCSLVLFGGYPHDAKTPRGEPMSTPTTLCPHGAWYLGVNGGLCLVHLHVDQPTLLLWEGPCPGDREPLVTGYEIRREPGGTSAQRGSPPDSSGPPSGCGEVFTYLAGSHALLKILPSPVAGTEGQCWARLPCCGNKAGWGCLFIFFQLYFHLYSF